jgi:CheY-like chemotaxis protein
MPSALVIEDDNALVDLMQSILRRCGYDAYGTRSSDEGIEFVMRHQPDIVFISDALPRLNPAEVCARIRSAVGSDNIVIILCSASMQARDPAYARQTGADIVLPKPYLPANVANILKRFAT